MFGEFIDTESPGRHRHGPGATGTGATDVFGRVADDENFAGGELTPGVAFGPRDGHGTECVAVVVIIPVGAEGEDVSQSVAGYFGVGAAGDVSGKEPEGEARLLFGVMGEPVYQAADTGEQAPVFPAPCVQLVAELPMVAGVEALDGIRGQRDGEVAEQEPDHAAVGAAREVERGKRGGVFVKIELVEQGRPERPESGTPGVDEGAVDIKQQQHGSAGAARGVSLLFAVAVLGIFVAVIVVVMLLIVGHLGVVGGFLGGFGGFVGLEIDLLVLVGTEAGLLLFLG